MRWRGQGVQEVRGRWRGKVEEQPWERELNRGKGNVEVCESGKSDMAVFGEA